MFSGLFKVALHRKQEVVNIFILYAATLYNTFSYGVLVCGAQSPSGLLLLFQV